MGQQKTPHTDSRVREVYEELGDLLEQGDDVFIENGPEVLKEAVSDPSFLDSIESDHAEPGTYTRKKVIGDEGRHVIRYMEWPPEYALMPHEHHGRPCFEVLVEGHLSLTDLAREKVGENEYRLEPIETTVTKPGESAVVDPRECEIHAVYSPIRSRSLHVYPDDNYTSYGYTLKEDAEGDVYECQEFRLRGD